MAGGWWSRLGGSALCALACAGQPVGLPSQPVPALRELVVRGTEAFRSGAWCAAEEAFALAERHYATSEVWKRGQLGRKVDSLHGLAAYQNGHDAEAIRLLRRWLACGGGTAEAEGAVRHALAQALFRSGDAAAACMELEVFERSLQGRPESVLVALLRARWLHSAGHVEEADALLARLSQEGGAVTSFAALQARLEALRLAIDAGDGVRAARLLLEQPWPAARMPETGALAAAALRIADRCLADGRHAEAWRALLLVPPRDRLVREQEKEVDRLRDSLQSSEAATLGAAWKEYHTLRLRRMESLLGELRKGEDYTPGMWFRQGMAGLQLGRHREACLAFERVARDPHVDAELRKEARHRWSIAAAGASEWETVLALARVQLAEAPGDPRTLDGLVLSAQAHLELGKIPEAMRAARLVVDTPGIDAERAGRASLLLGFCHLRADEMARAAESFAAAAKVDALRDRALLLQATAEEFGGRPEVALAILRPLRTALRGRPLYPDVLHRIASASRVLGDDTAAVDAASEHVRDHPLHPRRNEVLILLGDARLALGQADAAVAAFELVDASTGPAFAYAVFQRARVLQARGQWIALAGHLASYLELGLPWRRAEAVALRARALRELGRETEAREVVATALRAYGDDPSVRDIRALLHLWSELGGDAPDPASWRSEARGLAYQEKRYTWWSRLTVAEAESRRRRGLEASASELGLDLVRLVPRESLDAAGLLEASSALEAIGSPDAVVFLRDLVERFPNAAESVEARVRLAASCLREGGKEEAAGLVEAVLVRWPAHPAARRAVLLRAQMRLAEGRAREAVDLLQELLKRRDVRGRLQAEALVALGEVWEALGGRREAFASFQRVYSLHLSQADLAAVAWERAIRLLEELGEREPALELRAKLATCAALEGTGAPARARADLADAEGRTS